MKKIVDTLNELKIIVENINPEKEIDYISIFKLFNKLGTYINAEELSYYEKRIFLFKIVYIFVDKYTEDVLSLIVEPYDINRIKCFRKSVKNYCIDNVNFDKGNFRDNIDGFITSQRITYEFLVMELNSIIKYFENKQF
ncbi:hypothetical protein [Alkaliphilus sp. B6464]|uniref:hypothetical protein n=1 Tax=Alkaliphilus sp. B6464 TaxID=2731219 RepID=UPI001BA9785B|nr:hypothetical protein [Alkaliphilus sp. B6464]QUH21840.1 hypothetical protein HYG84_18055 [Alkaliphilus sp. B6464]